MKTTPTNLLDVQAHDNLHSFRSGAEPGPSLRYMGKWRLGYSVFGKLLLVCGALVCVGVLLAGSAIAQASNEQGFKPFGSYSGSNIDRVNVQNGHLELRVPLVSFPQRGGKLNVSFAALYHNAVWSESKDCVPTSSICIFQWKWDGQPGVKQVFEQAQPLVEQQLVNNFSNCLGGTSCSQYAYTLRMTDESGHPLGNLSGSVYESLDATGIQADVTSNKVVFPSGVRYTGNGYLEDTNGNQINLGQTIVDTLGRSIPQGGASTTDFSGCTGPLPIATANLWSVPGPNGGTSAFKFCFVSVKIFTNHWGGKVNTSTAQYIEPNGFYSMLQSIVLPDQTAWTFEYSQPDATGVNWADLIKIDTPTGGSISYTWSHVTGCSMVWGHLGSTSGFITQRTVDANDGNGPQLWKYSGGTVTDPAGNDTVHKFTDLSGCSIYETTTQYFQGTGTGRTLLKTVTTDYSSNPNPNYGGNAVGIQPNGPPAMNVVAIRSTTSWPNGQVRKTETDYGNQSFTFLDPFGNVSSIPGIYGKKTAFREYDFGNGAPGPLLRTTSTTYLWGDSTGAQYRTFNVLDVPISVSVLNPGGGGSLTSYAYDETVPAASGITTSHDSAPPNGNVRGNLTSIKNWENGNVVATSTCSVSGVNFFLTQTKTYLDTGMVSQSRDACGHTTTNQYAATPFAGAYLTQRCDPLNHCATLDYDLNTGLLASTTDPNNQKTSYTYDSFARLTDISYPDGGHTHGNYPDPVTVEIKRLENASANTWTDSYSYFDGFLRLKQTKDLDPEGDVFKDITHDALDRVLTSSNPHRATAAPTDGTTTNHYDALGRVIQVQHPDFNNLQTQYLDPNVVVLTDETGRQRREITDALGRLVQVDEPGDAFNGSKASGSLAIGGSLQTGTVGGVAAKGTVTIGGLESSTIIDPCASQGSCFTIGGGGSSCPRTIWDTGSVSVTVNGFTATAGYGQTSTTSTVASDLANAFNSNSSSPVTATVSSNIVTLTAKTLGTAGNSYALSASSATGDAADFGTASFTASLSGSTLAGGSAGTPTTDYGTVSMSISGYAAAANYGNGTPAGYTDSTAAAVAQDLVNKIKAQLPASNPAFSISVPQGGTTISINWNTVGSAGDVTVTVTAGSSNTAFAAPSFCMAISGQTCAGGTRNTALSGGADPYPSGIAHPYSTYYYYDTLNNLYRIEQHGNTSDSSQWRVRTFVYDSVSRLQQTTNPEAGTITYAYDADGDVVSRTAPAPSQTQSSGFTTTINYVYDVVNRVTSKSYTGNGYTESTPGSSYLYDSSCCGVTFSNPVGRLTGEFSGNTETLFSYDPMGRPITTWDCPPSGIARGFCYSHSISYDALGNLSDLIYPDGRNVSFAYTFPSNSTLSTGRPTAANLVSFAGTSVNQPYYTVPLGSSPATWGYNPDGSLQNGTFGNGVTESYGYNNRAQLNAIIASGLGRTWMGKSYGLYDSSGNDNGNILSITDTLSSGRNQFYGYDSLSRVVSGYQQDGSFNQTFTYDPWANMNMSGTNTFNAVYDGNNRIQGAGTGCTAANAYCYDGAGNMLNDGFHGYMYDAENRIKNVDGTSVAYTYDAAGERLRKDLPGGSTEYFYFAGMTIAELDPVAGKWSDYIFFGGRRLAKADSFLNAVQISGTECATCGAQWMSFSFPNAGGLNGYTIKSGDKLYVSEFNQGATVSGVGFCFTDGTCGWQYPVNDQTGMHWTEDTVANTWQNRVMDLTPAAGKVINAAYFQTNGISGGGNWAAYFNDFVMVAADGTVYPLYTREKTVSLAVASSGANITGSATVTTATNLGPMFQTTYYHEDQIGSSRILTSAQGWPVWQGTFTPFGQEVSAQITTNHYKFTGKERGDASEGGLDFFGARYYSSTMGRWMSPDWSATPSAVPYARVANPQSLNLYSYVTNDPLSNTDLDGHFQLAAANATGSDGSCGKDDGDACRVVDSEISDVQNKLTNYDQLVSQTVDSIISGYKDDPNSAPASLRGSLGILTSDDPPGAFPGQQLGALEAARNNVTNYVEEKLNGVISAEVSDVIKNGSAKQVNDLRGRVDAIDEHNQPGKAIKLGEKGADKAVGALAKTLGAATDKAYGWVKAIAGAIQREPPRDAIIHDTQQRLQKRYDELNGVN